MVDLDEPDHTRLCGLVHKAFTPRLVEQLRQRTHTLADELLDCASAHGEMDLVADYALSIPANHHRRSSQYSRERSAPLSSLVSSTRQHLIRSRHPVRSPAASAVHAPPEATVRRAATAPRDGLITALVQAEETGDRLNADELISMILQLLVAGHETTVNLIANGTHALIEQPAACERVRAEPDLLASGTAVDELLCYTSPVQFASQRSSGDPGNDHSARKSGARRARFSES